MTCRELAELLIDFVAGELGEEQAARLRKHMEECPPCVHYVATYQLTITITRQLPPAPLPPELLQRLREAVAEEKP